MIKLSVVIITFNEEKNIHRCIESVSEIADDIVVLDSFSTDNTEKICLDSGVKFIKHPFDGYKEQKNRAITHAKYQYILSLDADEALSEELIKSIKEVKENWQYDGYEINRLTNYCGKWIKHCGWYPDKKLRLFDSTKGEWSGNTNLHEKYELIKDAKIKHINGDLLHYSYYSITDHINQINKFTDISSKDLSQRGKNVTTFKIIGSAIFKFIRDYLLKLGFLDGYYGFVICAISAHATFLKYAKLKQLNSLKSVNR